MMRRSANKNNTELLLEMKNKLSQVDADIRTKKGRQEAFYEQLKKEFECETLDEADKKISLLDKKLDKMIKERDEGVESLVKNYDWGFDKKMTGSLIKK